MDNNNAANTGHQGGSEFAQKWIDDLQKRNATLNLIWPIMLVIILVLLVASAFFFHQYQTSMETDQLKALELDEMRSQRDTWQTKAAELESNNIELAQEIELLATVRMSLEEQKSDVSSELNVKDSLVDELRVKLAEQEKQVLEMTKSLLLTKKDLSASNQKSAAELRTQKSQYKQLKEELTKKLSDRKTAYQALVKRQRETKAEMERLANLVESKKTEVSQLASANNKLKVSLDSVTKELSLMEGKYSALENKMNNLVAPIASGKKEAADQQEINNTQVVNQTVAAPTLTPANTDLAFQPIVASKPKTTEAKDKKAKAPKPSALDFDSIAID